jgi:alcohol dehydrogenase
MARVMVEDVDGLTLEDQAAAFVKGLLKLQKACGVENLKMSEFGIKMDEISTLAENAHNAMGGLFTVDPYTLSMDETKRIIKNAYK